MISSEDFTKHDGIDSWMGPLVRIYLTDKNDKTIYTVCKFYDKEEYNQAMFKTFGFRSDMSLEEYEEYEKNKGASISNLCTGINEKSEKVSDKLVDWLLLCLTEDCWGPEEQFFFSDYGYIVNSQFDFSQYKYWISYDVAMCKYENEWEFES